WPTSTASFVRSRWRNSGRSPPCCASCSSPRRRAPTRPSTP
ncbi:MAG: hypothetical protein AVDCRST_MAG19-1082, partial [uncultured Thermomicrobiales bacterium]